MRVLLLHPNERQHELLPLIFRPLALESLAAQLDRHQVRIVDLRVDPEPLQVHLESFAPEAVGITCSFTLSLDIARRLAQDVRKSAPGVPIIVGGVHASLQPGDFAYPTADYVVKGAGERTLPELLDRLEAGTPADDVPGLFVMRLGETRLTAERPRSFRWSREYRLPARHLTAHYASHYTPAPTGGPMVLMITSRGCPHRCTFCAAWKLQGGRVDTREPRAILDEIRTLEESFIYFFDDNTFANRPAMRKLAGMLKAEGIIKRYQLWTSTDVICQEPSLLERWREVGLTRVATGFESIRDENLVRMRKRADVRQNEQALSIARQIGIDLAPTFIIDPDFTAGDFEALSDYAQREQLNMPWFFLLTPLPGTELFDRRAPDLIEGDPSRYDLMHLTLHPTSMPPGEFVARFVDLYLQNESWKAAAQRSPVNERLLRNIQGLLSQPICSRPVSGLSVGSAAFASTVG